MKIDELIDKLQIIKLQNSISGKDEIFAKSADGRDFLIDNVEVKDNEVEIILK